MSGTCIGVGEGDRSREGLRDRDEGEGRGRRVCAPGPGREIEDRGLQGYVGGGVVGPVHPDQGR